MDRGGGGGGDGSSSRYSLQPTRFCNEDILICVDVDLESQVEMEVSGPKGRPITHLDSIKQTILLFVNAKLVVLISGFLVRGDRPTHRRHVSGFLEAEQRLDAFQAEGKVSSDPVAIDAPGGFLLEWWSVFWDIFIARTNEMHSDVAASYIECHWIISIGKIRGCS